MGACQSGNGASCYAAGRSPAQERARAMFVRHGYSASSSSGGGDARVPARRTVCPDASAISVGSRACQNAWQAHTVPRSAPSGAVRPSSDFTWQSSDSGAEYSPAHALTDDHNLFTIAEGQSMPRSPDSTIRWKRGERVGGGSSANVFLALNQDSGALLAVKEIPMPPRAGPPRERNLRLAAMQREIDMLRCVNHPHIVKFVGSEVRANRVCIFTEYLGGGSVRSRIRKFGAFDESLAARFTRHLLLSLEYLHARGIVHCDVKCANILLDDNGGSKLADFGDALPVSADGWVHEYGHLHGTPRYLAPEAITSRHNGPPRDIWAAGCTLIYMLTGQPAWRHKPIRSVEQLVAFIDHTRETPLSADIAASVSSDAADFLRLTFVRDPLKRPSATQLLSHPFVARTRSAPRVMVLGRVEGELQGRKSPPANETRAPRRSLAPSDEVERKSPRADVSVGTDATGGVILVHPTPLGRHCSGSSKSSTDSGRGGFPSDDAVVPPAAAHTEPVLVLPNEASGTGPSDCAAADVESAVWVGGVVGAAPPGTPMPAVTKSLFGSSASGLSGVSSVATSTATASMDHSRDGPRSTDLHPPASTITRSQSSGAPRVRGLGRKAAGHQAGAGAPRSASVPNAMSTAMFATPTRPPRGVRRSGGDGRPWSEEAARVYPPVPMTERQRRSV